MRHPRIHRFLLWFGPISIAFLGGCIGLAAALAQASQRFARWVETEFDAWWPVVSALWFVGGGVAVIALYLAGLFYTGGSPSNRRLMQIRARVIATELRGRLRLAVTAERGSAADLSKWRKKVATQLVYAGRGLEEFDVSGLRSKEAEGVYRAAALIGELHDIAHATGAGDGYVSVRQAAGRYIMCGNKLYVELAALAGISPDWRIDD